MRSLPAFPLLLAALTAAVPPASAQRAGTPPQLTALVGATLINPGATPVTNAVVVTRGERIVCAGSGAACPVPRDARVVQLRDAFIIPGLIDAHVHYSQTGWVDGRPDAFDVRAEFPYEQTMARLRREPAPLHRAWLCTGVTSVYDVGGYTWTFALAKATAGATDAPRVRAAGPLLSTIDHWLNLPTTQQIVQMRSDSAVRSTVSFLAADGSDAIKVWYIDQPDTVRARLRPLLELAGREASRHGLPLIVHATELHTAKEALAAGATLLVHSIESDTIDAELVDLARRTGAIVIPTLTVREGYVDVFLGRSPAARYPLDCVDAETRGKLERALPEERLRPYATFVRSGRWDRQRQIMDENLRRLHAAGVPIAMGTDAGNPGTAHGPSVYREMEAMETAGLGAAEVLASATIVAARAMRIEDEAGTIEAGKRADLVVLDADPTVTISNVRQVRMVMRNGRLYGRAELLPRQ